MGLVFRGMPWCQLFRRFCQNTLLLLSKWRKTTKTLGVLMDKQNRPTFPYRPPNLLVLKWAKKNPRPHLLTFGYY